MLILKKTETEFKDMKMDFYSAQTHVVNGRVEILEDIKNSESDLKDFIIESLQGFLEEDIGTKEI
jgi:hypothetical protein